MKVTKNTTAKELPHYCDILGYSANGSPIRELTETSLNRIISKHNDAGFCIVSACRDKLYKDGTPVPRNKLETVSDDEILQGAEKVAENNRRTIALKNELIADGHSFLPVYGGFKEEGTDEVSFESSFIVFNFDRRGKLLDMDTLYNDCMKYGKEYYQDCILVKRPDGKPYYANCTPEHFSEVDMEFTGDYTLNDLTQMYFTALKKFGKNDNGTVGKPQRFTLEHLYYNPAPTSTSEAVKRFRNYEII